MTKPRARLLVEPCTGMSYFQTDTEPGNEEETEEEVGSEEQGEDGGKSAVSNPLNKFSKFSQTEAKLTKVARWIRPNF